MPDRTVDRIHAGEMTAANDDLPRRTTRRQRWLMVFSFLVSIAVGAGLATCAKADIVGTAEALDGDDLMIRMLDGGEQRVRLLGIDSPEMGQKCIRAREQWACGVAARDKLALIVAGKTVSCGGGKRKLFSSWRVKRRCTVDGQDIGLQLVAAGLSVARYLDYQDAESEGKAARRGMWEGCFDDPSWWRLHRRHLGICG